MTLSKTDAPGAQLKDILRSLNELHLSRVRTLNSNMRSEIFLALSMGFTAGLFLATLLFVGITFACWIYVVILILDGVVLVRNHLWRSRSFSENLITFTEES